MKKIYIFIIGILLLCITMSGCTTGPKPEYSDFYPTGEPEPIEIVSTIFPIYDFTKQLTKNCNVKLTMLLDPGEDIHTYKPSKEDINLIKNCDLFICLGSESEAWVDAILSDDPTLESKFVCLYDAAISIEIGYGTNYEKSDVKDDEHVWMYIQNDISMVDVLATKISNIYYDKDIINKNKIEYMDLLTGIEDRLKDIISRASSKEIFITDRFPFIYLTNYYGLSFYKDLSYYSPYVGCGCENEQSIIDTDFLIHKIKEDNITTVFYTELDDHKVTDMIKEKTGCKTKLLHSCHTVTQEDFDDGVAFADLLNYDLDVLEEALCSDQKK